MFRMHPCYLTFILGFISYAKGLWVEVTDVLFVLEGQCDGAVDLIIAIPSGWQVPVPEFAGFERHLTDLMYHVNINPSHFNIGLLRYGETPTVFSSPQPFKSRSQVNTRITLLTQRDANDGLTLDVARAIREMDKMAHTPSDVLPTGVPRDNERKFGILYTYNDSIYAPDIEEAAHAMRSRGMLLHVVHSSGNRSGSAKVFDPAFHYLGTDLCRFFSLSSFETTLDILTPLLAQTICSEIDPTVLVTNDNCQPKNYSVATPTEVTCARWNNMVQPDPNNCAYFYKCDNFDSDPLHFACPYNLLFDPYVGVCNFADYVTCFTDLLCPTDTPKLYPHPMDCRKYINCDSSYVPRVQTCLHGTVFDPDWQTCNKSTEVDCVLPRV